MKNQTLFITDERARKAIRTHKLDFDYSYKIKYNDDSIFTSGIDGTKPLRRETFTRLANKELKSFEDDLRVTRKKRLSSKSFQNWDESENKKIQT